MMIVKFNSHIGPLIHPAVGSISSGQVFECPEALFAEFDKSAPGKVVAASQAEQEAFLKAKRGKAAQPLEDGDGEKSDNVESEVETPAPAARKPGRPAANKG